MDLKDYESPVHGDNDLFKKHPENSYIPQGYCKIFLVQKINIKSKRQRLYFFKQIGHHMIYQYPEIFKVSKLFKKNSQFPNLFQTPSNRLTLPTINNL